MAIHNLKNDDCSQCNNQIMNLKRPECSLVCKSQESDALSAGSELVVWLSLSVEGALYGIVIVPRTNALTQTDVINNTTNPFISYIRAVNCLTSAYELLAQYPCYCLKEEVSGRRCVYLWDAHLRHICRRSI